MQILTVYGARLELPWKTVGFLRPSRARSSNVNSKLANKNDKHDQNNFCEETIVWAIFQEIIKNVQVFMYVL